MKRQPTKKWSYTYGTLASLFGMSREAVRKRAQRRQFAPSSLRSIIDFYCLRQARGSRYNARQTQHG